jgi:hypothetical protein
MAKKTDIAAAKARKQKIILAAAGVAMLGVAAIQVPKLMKSDSQATAAPAATAATTAAPTATVTAAAVVGGANPGTFEPAAYVAGVALPSGATVVVAKSRLASFTLFEAKDPFVQQASDATATGQAGAAPTPSVDPAPTASGSEPAAVTDGGTSTAPPPPPVVYATVLLDGKSQPLKVKQKFPTGDPLFVLVGLAKNRAKIGVAGGSFDDGQNVTLTLGKKVTLVDTATGVRYELKLVYTGSAPEQVEGFSASTATPAP